MKNSIRTLLLALIFCDVALNAAAQDVEVFPQLGQSGVISVAFSPDGRYIISGAVDSTIKLWDIETGREIRTFSGHSYDVTSVAFSPDGKQILSGSHDFTVKLWDIATGQEIRTFSGHDDNITSVAFSPDGKQALSGSEDYTVRLWDIATGEETRIFSGHTDIVVSVAFNLDGQQVLSGQQTISGSDDPTIKLWDIASGQEIRTFSVYPCEVASISFSPDGLQALSAGGYILKLWDIATGQEIRTFSGHDDWISSLAFSPDGKQVLSGSEDKAVKLWDIATGREIRTFSGHTTWVSSLSFSPDGKHIISGAVDSTIKLWDITTGREVRTFSGNVGWINRYVAFSPDGNYILSGSVDSNIKLWDITTGREIKTFSGHNHHIISVAFSPDGRHIISGSVDSTVKLWDVLTGKEIKTFPGHTSWVTSVAFSPDGMQILSGSYDNTMILWDTATGQEIRTFYGHTDHVTSVAFSPDGKYILSGSADSTTKLWDIASGQEIKTFSRNSDFRYNWVVSVAFSPDGQQAISGSWDSTIIFWDIATGQEIRTFSGPYGLGDLLILNSVSFSPDKKQMLLSYQRTITLFNLENSLETRTLTGHASVVDSTAFSPNGKHALSGSLDGTTRLWDVATGKEIASFISFSGSDTQLTANSRGIKRASEEKAAEINGEWICITPDGYYAASPRGDRYLNVRIGNKVTGIDSFRHIFYNPDLVAARLAGRPDPVSANTINIQDAVAFFPPTVTLNASSTTTSGIADIAVNITDDNQPLQSIKVVVNGRLVGGEELSAVNGTQGLTAERASIAVSGNQKSVSFSIPLTLDPGNNLVELIAYNGYAESRQSTSVEWVTDSDYKPELPNLWLLAIGVNEYDDEGITNLSFCAKDAGEIVNSFMAQEGRRYAKVNSLLVADDEAIAPDAKNVRESLSFLEGAGPRDIVLLFMAGHGVNGPDGVFCYLPKDARENPDGSFSNVITGDEINRVLDSPGNRLIFIDACHSGSMDNDRMLRLFMDTNAYVFAACRGNELSYEPPELGHGIFTYSIVNTLNDPDTRALGNLSVLGLSSQVSIDVPRKLKELWYPEQNPVGYSLGFYDFVIGE